MSSKPKQDKKSTRKGRSTFEDKSRKRRFRRNTLDQLDKLIPWEEFRPILLRIRKLASKGGRPPYDEVFMFKCFVLQRLYGLSDEELEYQVADRHSFQKFLGIDQTSTIPNQSTFFNFRESLRKHKLNAELNALFKQRLTEQRLVLRKGVVADAKFVRTPLQSGPRKKTRTTEEEKSPKEEQRPKRGRPPKKEQSPKEERPARRGRPPKKDQSPKEERPARRGRPPKNDQSPKEERPARRGRPPKAARTIEKAPAPRRGRPPKTERTIEKAPAPRRGRPPKQGATVSKRTSARKRATV